MLSRLLSRLRSRLLVDCSILSIALQVNRLEAFYPPQALQAVQARLDRVDFKCAPPAPRLTSLTSLHF